MISAIMCEKLNDTNERREDFRNIQPDIFFWRQEGNNQFGASRTQGLIPPEFANPKCLLCARIIQQVNEIFERDNSTCSDPREYCMTHLLEAVHTSLVWRLCHGEEVI